MRPHAHSGANGAAAYPHGGPTATASSHPHDYSRGSQELGRYQRYGSDQYRGASQYSGGPGGASDEHAPGRTSASPHAAVTWSDGAGGRSGAAQGGGGGHTVEALAHTVEELRVMVRQLQGEVRALQSGLDEMRSSRRSQSAAGGPDPSAMGGPSRSPSPAGSMASVAGPVPSGAFGAGMNPIAAMQDPNLRWCDVCQCSYQWKTAWSHFEGKRHKQHQKRVDDEMERLQKLHERNQAYQRYQ
jgi:hypothetical protein